MVRSASNTSSTSRFGVVSSTGRPAKVSVVIPRALLDSRDAKNSSAAGDQCVHVLADAARPDPVRELERLGTEDRHTVAGDEHVNVVT